MSRSLQVRVTPRSSRRELKVDGELVCVWVSASPTDGQANDAVCELLAERLRVPKSSVRVARGLTSRYKQIEIDNLDSDTALARLR